MRWLFNPASLGVAIMGALLAAVILAGVGVAVVIAGGEYSVRIGVMLIFYAVLVAAGAWLGLRRHWLAFGAIITPALIHLVASVDFVVHGDVTQRSVAAGMIALSLTTVVAVAWPTSRAELSPSGEPPQPESR